MNGHLGEQMALVERVSSLLSDWLGTVTLHYQSKADWGDDQS